MSTGSSAEPTGANSRSGGAGADSAARRVLEEVQLARLAAQIRELGVTRDVVRALGEDPDQYAARLVKQYRDLAARLRKSVPLQARSLPPNVVATLDRLGDIFNWWKSVLAPNATVMLVQTPGGAETGGTGIGADIFQGDLALGGEIWNAGTAEQWWVNTWQYTVAFPGTPQYLGRPASLSYRFNIGANIAFYRQDVVSGSVHVYVTVASTPDINTQPIDYNNFASSDFAIIATLPTSTVPPMLSGSAKVTGTIPLVAGGTPAIGILIGLIISVVDGDVQIIPGEYSSIILAPPDATMPSDIGKVEYRRDPPFWVEAVGQILDRV
jgi:hypothetical protein